VVLNASWNDDVGNFPLGIDILLKIWLYERKPLLDDTVNVAASVPDISYNSSGEACVGIGLTENLLLSVPQRNAGARTGYLHVQELKDPRVIESEDTLEDNDMG
jgi:hypothetical protein